MPKLNGLQMLRVAAAYLIVVYHSIEHLAAMNSESFSRFLMAPLGVDLFFVISGFVMVHITQQGETPLGFLIKRMIRIVPLYWIATLGVIITLYIIPWSFHEADLSPDAIAASFFFIPHSDLSGRTYPLLMLGWTLNMEMLFYIFFALAIAVSQRWRVPLVIAFITIAIFTARALDGTIADFYGALMIFEFVIGCAIALAFQNTHVQNFIRRTPMWPFVIIGIGLFALSANYDLDNDSRLMRYGLPAALIVAAVAGQDLFRKPIPHNVLVPIGDSSYSAYLLHEFVVVALVIAIPGIFGYSLLTGIIMITLTVIGAGVVSALSYRWFEMPSNRWLRKKVLRKKPKAAPPPPAYSGTAPK